jgi:hypothetical protein
MWEKDLEKKTKNLQNAHGNSRKILIIDEIKKIKMNVVQISEYCIYYVN